MTRVLKRPMFRLGGNTDQGIMSGVVPRQGYSYGELVKKAQEDKALLKKLVGQTPMGYTPAQGLIDWGLNVASATPSGSILNVAAESAKEPVAKYQTAKAQRSAFDQQLGLSAAESAIAHRDKMKELALKGRTTGLIDDEKEARILWANRRTETNPSGSFNEETGKDWTSYNEVLNWIVTKSQYSRSGQYSPGVQKDIAINAIYDFMVENDENVPDAYSNAQQMKEIAEISYNVNNDPFYEDIKKQFDYNQIVIDPKNFGDKLPATETAGSTSYQLKDYNSSEDPDYQHDKIYHNYEDGNFYLFNSAGNGSFILVTLTKE
jgi:hypothetical protein